MALEKAGSGSIDDMDFNAVVDAVRAAVKHVVVGIDYTDINLATGLADLYLLPDNETLVAIWFVVTTVFNGATSDPFPFEASQAYSPSGSDGGQAVSDTFTCIETSASDPADGLIFPGPAQAGNVLANLGLFAPVPGGGPVQLVIDFPAGGGDGLPVDRGTTGHLDVHLVLAVAP